MPITNTTYVADRRPQRDLSPAPSIRVPDVVRQPTPAVAGISDNKELLQISDALGDFAPSLRRFGTSEENLIAPISQDKGRMAALGDPEKARQAAQKGWRDAASEGLVPEGANPFFQMAYYETSGELLAKNDYTKALQARKNEAENPDAPNDIGGIIGEERGKFMQSLGDKYLVRNGASKAMEGIENEFRQRSQEMRTKTIEKKSLEVGSAKGNQILSGFNSAQSDEEENQIIDNYKGFGNMEYQNGRLDITNFLWDTAKGSVLAISDPRKARRMVDKISNMETVSGAKLGNIPAIALQKQEVLNYIDRKEKQDLEDFKSREGRVQTTFEQNGQFAGASMIQKRQAAALPLDDEWTAQAARDLKLHIDPDGTSPYTHNVIAQFQDDVSKAGGPEVQSNPVAVKHVETLLDDFQNTEASTSLDISYKNGDISFSDRMDLLKQIQNGGQLGQFMADKDVQAAARKAVDASIDQNAPKGTFDDQARLSFRLEAEKDFSKVLGQTLKQYQTGGQSLDDIKQRLPEIVNTVADTVNSNLEKHTAEIKADRKRAEDAINAPKNVNPKEADIQGHLSFWKSEVSKIEDRAQKMNRIVALSEFGTLSQTQKQTAKVLQLDQQDAIRKQLGGIADKLQGTQGKDREAVMSEYFRVKHISGYTPQEVLGGLTHEGLPVNLEAINPYTTPLFDSVTEYEHAMSQPNKGAIGELAKKLKVQPQNFADFALNQRLLLLRNGRTELKRGAIK